MEPMEKLKQILEGDMNKLKEMLQENKKQFCDATNQINVLESQKNVDMTDGYIELCKKEQQFMETAAYHMSALQNFLVLVNMEKGKVLYRDFNALCTYLESISFATLDTFQILCTLIESNIKAGLLEEEKKIEKIPFFQFKMMSYLEIHSNFYNRQYTDEEIERRGQILGIDVREKKIIKSDTAVEISTLQMTHQMMQQCYFDKKDTYTIDDIQKIVNALKQLKVPTRFCEAIKTKLNRNIEKRLVQSNHPYIRQQIKLGLSDKEYKEKLKQVKEYYNGYTGEILKPIGKEQMIYLAALMIELGYDKKDINQFYQDVHRSNLQNNAKIDCITEFYMLYPKLEFYSKDNFELTGLLEEATSYLFELFGCVEEDYSFWYLEFQNVVFKLRMRIPNTYDYEYNQAVSLAEKEKQKSKMRESV